MDRWKDGGGGEAEEPGIGVYGERCREGTAMYGSGNVNRSLMILPSFHTQNFLPLSLSPHAGGGLIPAPYVFLILCD